MAVARKARSERQESWRLGRVKRSWRRPRGVTSRMRREKKGWPRRAKAGYGSNSEHRGLHPSGLSEKLAGRLSDLEGLDSSRNIVRLSRKLGEKKRLALLDSAKRFNLRVVNPGKQEAVPTDEEAARKAKPADEPEEHVAESTGGKAGDASEVEQEVRS